MEARRALLPRRSPAREALGGVAAVCAAATILAFVISGVTQVGLPPRRVSVGIAKRGWTLDRNRAFSSTLLTRRFETQKPSRTVLYNYPQYEQAYYPQGQAQGQANLQQLPQYVASGALNVPDHPPGTPATSTLLLLLIISSFSFYPLLLLSVVCTLPPFAVKAD